MAVMKKQTIVAQQLGLADDLARGNEQALFKWLVACLLFAKPIQQTVAWQAYRTIVEDHQYDTPGKLAACTRANLVGLLGDAHYVRFDNSTAVRLIKLGKKLLADYDGKMTTLRAQSSNREDFVQRLLTFYGVGPKAVEIFMRDAEAGLFPTPGAQQSPAV